MPRRSQCEKSRLHADGRGTTAGCRSCRGTLVLARCKMESRRRGRVHSATVVSVPSILGGIGLQHALADAHQCADAWREIASWSRCHQRRQQRARLQRGYPYSCTCCRIRIWACRACRPRRKAPAWCAIHVATAPGRRSKILISIPVCVSMSLDTGRNKSKQKDARVLSAGRGPSLDR